MSFGARLRRFPANIVMGLVATVLTPVIVIGLSVLVAVRATALPDDAVLKVYDTVVSKDDLRHRMEILKALYGIEAPPDPKAQDLFRRQSAEAVGLSMVLDRAAHDEGITVADKDARDLLARTVTDGFPDGMTGFARLLGEVGASEQDVVDELKRQQATRLLFDKVVAGQGASGQGASGEVSEAHARQYYDSNPQRFVQPEGRHLRNIVVATRNDADEVFRQAGAGADFVALAKQLSLDQSTRDAGGDLGFVRRDQLEGAYSQAAFAAGAGGIFGPAQTKKGWNIGQVLEIRPAAALPFGQVKDQLRSELRDQRASSVWRTWVGRRIADAHITYGDDYRPRGTDVPPGAPPGSVATEQEVPR